jgi:hypothetical protein
MGIDAGYLGAAVGCGAAEEVHDRLLRIIGRAHASSSRGLAGCIVAPALQWRTDPGQYAGLPPVAMMCQITQPFEDWRRFP